MAYPILAPSNTWWAPHDTTIARKIITEIELMDSYTPDSSVTIRDSWDASAAKDGSITCYVIGTKLIIAGNGSGKIAANRNSSSWFQVLAANAKDCDQGDLVESISGLGVLDTSNTSDFSSMFASFYIIKSLDLSGFNTSSATTMGSMFNHSLQLEYVNGLEEMDTSNVTNMSRMFSGTKIANFQRLNTSNVTDISYMFRNYQRESLVFPAWDLSKVTSYTAIFAHCSSGLKHLDLRNFSFKGLTKSRSMFDSSKAFETIIFPKNFGSTMSSMSMLFSGCTSLKSVNLNDFDMSKVTSTYAMFENCKSLTSIDVSNWNTSNITDMGFMFYGCSALKEIDVSNWDVSKVTTFDHFAAHAGLRRKGMEKWNTSSATNMNAMFHNCAEEELDLSGFNVSKVQIFSQMFENSPNLKRIKGLEKWNTSAGLDFSGMFERCYKLEELDLSSFDTSKAKNGVVNSDNGGTSATLFDMFVSCNNLRKVTVGDKFSINGNGTNTNASYKAILPTPSAEYISGADGKWYNLIGDSFAPNGMKDKTAETYYASYDIVANLDVVVKNGSMIDIARAIREKTNSTNRYTPAQFGEAIRSIDVRLVVDENGDATLVNAELEVDETGAATIEG